MNLRTKCGQPIRLRWMIASDLPEVLAIERASFAHPWGERQFVEVCSARDRSIMVAENDDAKHGERIVGFMAYGFEDGTADSDGKFHLINLAVCPFCRRRGIGRMLLEHLVSKLAAANDRKGRKRLQYGVWEGNTAGQLFLRACGMRCVAIIKDAYKDYSAGQDAYLFTRGKEVTATLPQEVL